MELSAIVINHNTSEMTGRAIERFLAAAGPAEKEIILIDNGSAEKLAGGFLALPELTLISNEKNLGFARAANQGIRKARGRYILLLNSDCLLAPGSLAPAISYLDAHGEAAILGLKMVYPDGRVQPSFGNFPDLFREIIRFSNLYRLFPGGTLIKKNLFSGRYFKKPSEVDWVSGGAMMIRREALERLGLLDEEYFFGVEDLDLCFRAKEKGPKVIYFPEAEAVHHHGFSSGGKRSVFSWRNEAEGFDTFFKKHGGSPGVRHFDRFAYNLRIFIFSLLKGKS